MTFDAEMQAALIADGEKLAVLTGEDHGPYFDYADEQDPAGRIAPASDRPIVAEQQGGDWRIEVMNKDGSHHSYVPRYAGNIAPSAAMAALNQTLDASRFTARIVVA